MINRFLGLFLSGITIVLLVFGVAPNYSFGQDTDEFEKAFEKEYAWRITQTHLYGIYIPYDLMDAFNEIERLSEPESLDKFSKSDEIEVAKKLHFGLGRWISMNWGMYEGSRFSAYLKEMGLSHPDDMTQFVLRTFHRHLNQEDLDEEALIEQLRDLRRKEFESNIKVDTFIIDPPKN